MEARLSDRFRQKLPLKIAERKHYNVGVSYQRDAPFLIYKTKEFVKAAGVWKYDKERARMI